MSGPADIKNFYNGFASDVLLKDFRRLNLRQEDIKQLCDTFVPRGARVLEIGCGVGIISKHLQSIASEVLGVDISEKNIEIAMAFAGSDRCEMKVLDVVEQANELEQYGKFDVILLPDVIEHIPENRHADLLSILQRHLNEPGWVLFTFPSPEYQAFLADNNPETLQVIDETIEVDELLRNTSLKLVYFSYRNAGSRNQYIHAVLTSDRSFQLAKPTETPSDKIAYRFRKYRWRLRNAAFLRRIRRQLASARRGPGSP